VGGELVEEGHRGAVPAAVDQLPLRPGGAGGLDHRQHRSDPDPAGDEQVARGDGQGEVVPRAADPDQVAGGQLVVDVQRPAAAVGVAQDAEPVGLLVPGRAAQRVLPDGDAVEDEVDVRAWFPRRQRLPGGLAQAERHDILGGGGLALDPDDGLELAAGQGQAGVRCCTDSVSRGRIAASRWSGVACRPGPNGPGGC
jgi:hypothetical protein